MIIIGRNLASEFCDMNRDATDAMVRWLRITQEALWKNFPDLRQTFNSADYAGNGRFVFDIRGNRYRIIAEINFEATLVRIKFVGTHKDYGKIDASTI